MDKVEDLALNINNLPGVVEHGIFIGLCDEVFVEECFLGDYI